MTDNFIILRKREEDGKAKRLLLSLSDITYIEEFTNGCLVMLNDDNEYGIEVKDTFDEILKRLYGSV